MASKNISVLDILKQVQTEQNEILTGLKQVNNSEILTEIETGNPEVREILEEISKNSKEFAQTLGEINEQING
jgi:spore coat protein CotF